MSKLRTYKFFKTELTTESYLYLNIPKRIRSLLAKFRIGVHELEIEIGRHQKKTVEDRLCKLCMVSQNFYVEDEYHVLLKCPAYEELRNIYLTLEQTPRNMYTFIAIMCSEGNSLAKLGCFIANICST